MSGKLNLMPSDTNESAPGSALLTAKKLAERELERLKEELEVVKAGTHPRRRSLIIGYVKRIDERQDALEKLEGSTNNLEQPDQIPR